MSTKRDRLLHRIALVVGVPEKGTKRFWRARSHRDRGAFRRRIESLERQGKGVAMLPSEVYEMLQRGNQYTRAEAYVIKTFDLPKSTARADIGAIVRAASRRAS